MARKFGYWFLAVVCTTLITLVGCTERKNPLETQFSSPRLPFKGAVPFQSIDLNPLGDGNSRIVSVAFAAHDSISVPQPPFPVLYLLHDFGGDGTYFDRYGLQGILDDMYRKGEIGRMLVVTVGAKNSFGGSYYRNSPSTGKYEDLIGETIRYIERNFHVYTQGGRSARAISGHGMGGYGAVRYAMEHPELFGSVSSMSAPLAFNSDWLSKWKDSVFQENAVTAGDDSAYVEIAPAPAKPFTNQLFAMAAAFSPRDLEPFNRLDTCLICKSLLGCPPIRPQPCYPCSVFVAVPSGRTTFHFPRGTGARPACSKPKTPSDLGVDLPFDQSGDLLDSIWNLWLQQDARMYLENHPGVFDSTDMYFDCGIDDELGFLQQNRMFKDALNAAGIPPDRYEYHEYTGYKGLPAGHGDLIAQRLRAIIKFHSDRFVRPKGTDGP